MAEIPFREDFMIYGQMLELAACLCAELAASGLGSPCFCGIVEGTEANLDCGSCDDGCGAAWVRLDSAVPFTNFPDAEVGVATCSTALAFVLEVGVTRCFTPFVDDQGTGAGVQEHLDQTRLQIADMAATRRAIACCFAKDEEILYALGAYTPISFQGGCGGGSWLVTVAGR